MVLVGLTLSAMLAEGSAIDWSVIYMRDIFATVPLINGLALALTAFFQFITRYFADHFVVQYGPHKVAKICLWIMLAGVILVAVAPACYRVCFSRGRVFCNFSAGHVSCCPAQR